MTLPNRYGSVVLTLFPQKGWSGWQTWQKTGQAEIAMLVRSDWKRRGVGVGLMRAALRQATQERLQVHGFIQPSNAAILGSMRRFGFVQGSRLIDHAIMHWRPAEPYG
jgi:GNAT superfamily N-acetyltransferase